MATIEVPAYRATYASVSDALPSSYDDVAVRITMAEEFLWFTYSHSRQGDDDFISRIWSRHPLDLTVDGSSLFSGYEGRYGVRELEMSHVSGDGIDVDFAMIGSDAEPLTVYMIPLAGQGFPATLEAFAAIAYGRDAAIVTPILSGPFAPTMRVPLADIPDARITHDDFVDHREKPRMAYGAYDTIDTGRGRDVVLGGPGEDVVRLGGGADRAFGGRGGDILHGFAGNDVLYGGRGEDSVYGTGGRDRLRGNEGADYLFGGAGDDILVGGGGADILRGGGQDDTLRGGRRADVLAGERGNDSLHGGRGNDVFVFTGGNDTVEDFDLRGRNDRVVVNYEKFTDVSVGQLGERRLAAIEEALRDAAEMQGGNLVLDFGRRGSLTYEGRDMGDLDRILNERNLVPLSADEIADVYGL